MPQPAPSVFLHSLSESSVDFRLFFWAADISTWLSLKSRVLADIYEAFAKEGIDIPFRQQDVRVIWPKGLPPIKIEAPGINEAEETEQDTDDTKTPKDQDL
jgi:small-conductance mechanosensitive channel